MCWLTSDHVFGQEALYKQYVDPAGRFSFEYPATMKLEAAQQDEVTSLSSCNIVSYLRVCGTDTGQVQFELPMFCWLYGKRALQEEMKNVSVLGEGKLEGLQGSQGYVAVSFTDKKGVQLVQMVQYYVSEDRFLQMTISDRPEGFKNLETVIRKIHQSLKILKPKLK